MKKMLLACAFASILIGKPFSFYSYFPRHQHAFITGKISPGEASDVTLIIHGSDTLPTPVISGQFSRQVKPGVYKLIVRAKTPFRDVSIANLEVRQNRTLNVGELLLQK